MAPEREHSLVHLHRLHHPRRGEDLPMVGDLLPGFDGVHGAIGRRRGVCVVIAANGKVQPRRPAVAGKARLKGRHLRRRDHAVKAARGGVGCNQCWAAPQLLLCIFTPTLLAFGGLVREFAQFVNLLFHSLALLRRKYRTKHTISNFQLEKSRLGHKYV